MPRKLPWKLEGQDAASIPSRNQRERTNATPESSRRQWMPSSTKSTASPRPVKRDRSPSTSPPPAPPVESFMIEGLENDDGWRMVEDEFFTVAGAFTAHLHAAEYQRLKKLARSQNEETIRHISRPVTGETTELVKRRHLALDQASRQRKGLKRALAGVGAEEDDDNDAPWAGTSLQGLMDSPRKQLIPLAAVASVVSGTRAAAGYSQGSPTRGSGMARPRIPASYASTPKDRSGRNLKGGSEDEETEDDGDGDLDLDGPLRDEPMRRITSTPAPVPKLSPAVSPSIGRKPSSYGRSKPTPRKEEAVGVLDEDPDASMFIRRSRK